MLGVDFCGGLTTFSSPAVEVAEALQEGRLLHAVAELVVSLILGVVLASLGWVLTTQR